MGEPLTMNDLLQLLAFVGGVAGLWWKISSQIEASRVESREGRKDLYKHIDSGFEKVSQTYVLREIHEKDVKALQHAVDENTAILTSMAGRICPYPPKE